MSSDEGGVVCRRFAYDLIGAKTLLKADCECVDIVGDMAGSARRCSGTGDEADEVDFVESPVPNARLSKVPARFRVFFSSTGFGSSAGGYWASFSSPSSRLLGSSRFAALLAPNGSMEVGVPREDVTARKIRFMAPGPDAVEAAGSVVPAGVDSSFSLLVNDVGDTGETGVIARKKRDIGPADGGPDSGSSAPCGT
jgi:hypothetical protein